MSEIDPDRAHQRPPQPDPEPPPRPANLFLLYALLLLGLLAAMAFAALIVYPFYLRR